MLLSGYNTKYLLFLPLGSGIMLAFITMFHTALIPFGRLMKTKKSATHPVLKQHTNKDNLVVISGIFCLLHQLVPHWESSTHKPPGSQHI